MNAPLFILINIEMAKISICCSHVMFNLPAAIAGDDLADDTEKILSIRRYPRRTHVSLHLLTIFGVNLQMAPVFPSVPPNSYLIADPTYKTVTP